MDFYSWNHWSLYDAWSSVVYVGVNLISLAGAGSVVSLSVFPVGRLRKEDARFVILRIRVLGLIGRGG
jgi:hypothetical protein